MGQSPGGGGGGGTSHGALGGRGGRIETGGGDRESETQNSRGGSEKGLREDRVRVKVRASWGAETGATGFRDAGYLAQPRDERI